MINELVYRDGDYREVVILETELKWQVKSSGIVYTEKVRLVMVTGDEKFMLYRLEAPYTKVHNRAYSDSLVATIAYAEAVQETLELCEIARDLPEPYAQYTHRQHRI